MRAICKYIMAAALLVCCFFVPQKVWAEECNVEWPTFKATSIDGKIVDNSYAEGKTKLIIFYRNGCSNSQHTIQGIKDAVWISNPDLAIIAVEIDDAPVADVKNFANTYANGGKNITFCTNSGYANQSFLRAVGHSGSYVLPASFIVDENGVIRQFYTGFTEALTYRLALAEYTDGIDEAVSANLYFTGVYDYDRAWELFASFNEMRVQEGLKPLKMDAALMEAAMQRAVELSVWDSSDRPNGEKFTTVPGIRGDELGQNRVCGYQNADDVAQYWMYAFYNSIHPNFCSTGIGVFSHNGTIYWVQLFSDAAASTPTICSSKTGTATVEVIANELSICSSVSSIKLKQNATKKITVYADKYMGIDVEDIKLNTACIDFSSSAKTIAKISSKGVVTAVQAGTAKIQIGIVGGSKKITVPVTVQKSVTIVKQPVSVGVANGEKATVSVIASGDGLKYAWYFKDPGSSKYSLTKSFTGKTYAVTMSDERAGRKVYCVISDRYGNEIQTKTVSLDQAVKITKQPKTTYASLNATAKTTVTATGKGLTYQWYIKNAGASSYTKSSVKTASYSCKMSSTSNGRYVRCKVTDQYGNSVWTKTVRLHMKASITTQPANKIVKTGTTVKFAVKAVGSGLKYQWQYRTSSSGSWKNVSAANGKKAAYTLTAEGRHNGYQYRCCVTDSYGEKVYTKTVTLNVLVINTQPISKTVKAGTTAKFTVSAVGKGLTFQWQYRTSSSGSWKNVSAANGKTAAYSLKAAARHNGYQYRCRITDSAGNVIYSKTVQLTVK